jgi:hypothetical protein
VGWLAGGEWRLGISNSTRWHNADVDSSLR